MLFTVKWVALLSLAWIFFAQHNLAPQDVTQQIEQLSSPAQAEALGAKLLQESRVPAVAAVRVWQAGDQGVRQNARIVLNEMEEAALDPLLKVKGNLDPAEQAWRITMVVDTLSDLRKSTATMIDRQLSNKQSAPLPSTVGAEEREQSRRVCDEAYVQMSRLTAANPDAEAFLLKMRQFRRMSDTERNAEIQRARQSAAWRALLR